MVIAEKPKAAAKIAEALGAKPSLIVDGVRVWAGRFRGRNIVITSTAGHLYTLYTNERGFPVFKCEWGPRWLYEPGSGHLRKYYNALKKLSARAEAFVNACDYDIEGSVIGYNIIRHLGDVKRAYRAKFSALTREDILKAFENLQPLDWNNIESGLARHVLDWIWGINVSRALMEIYKRIYGEKETLSAGRVQSPTLLELVRRHAERETFIPDVRFSVTVKVSLGDREYALENRFEPFRKLEEAEAIAETLKARKRLVVVRAERRILELEPPPPFNLTELQLEAARAFGYSPARTLEIAEELYLDSLISYPRTNSEKIPPTIDNPRILRGLSPMPDLGKYASELLSRNLLKPREGPGDDPAHPAIHPTGYLPSRRLSKEEQNIFELVVRRYLASFYPCAKVEEKILTLREPITGVIFSITGRRVLSHEWLRVYKYRRVEESDVPNLSVGEEVEVSSVRLSRVYTRRPLPHTKASVLRWMESVGIGTEATRAEIIETLFRRRYVRGRNMEVTSLGLRVARILSTLFKEITEVELTREFERRLRAIMLGNSSMKEVVEEAVLRLGSRLEEIKRMLNSYEEGRLKEKLGLSAGSYCSICGEDSVEEVDGTPLCALHLEAYRNLIKKYGTWRENMNVRFEEYMKIISRLRSTGRYVKELIEYLTKRVR